MYIIAELCKRCKRCLNHCPSSAISFEMGNPEIDPAKCQDCEKCLYQCLNGAIVGG